MRSAARAPRARRAPRSSDTRRTRCRRASGTEIARRNPSPADERQRPPAAPERLEKERPHRQRVEREPEEPRLRRDGHRRRVRRRLLRILALSFTRSAYARLNPPTPTPVSGWWTAMRIPFATSSAAARRVVQAVRRVVCGDFRTCGCATEMPASTATASTTATSACQRQATNAAPTTTTRSAAKLDCEYEIRRPSHVPRVPPQREATSGATGRGRSARSTGSSRARGSARTPTKRKNTEFTRKKRRVRVRVDHLRVLEDVPRLVLVEADDRERECHHGAPDSARTAEPAPRQPGEREREQGERDVEGEQLGSRLRSRPCSTRARNWSSRRTPRAATTRGGARARFRHLRRVATRRGSSHRG